MMLHEHLKKHIRFVVVAAILAVSISASYIMGLRIISQFFYYQAKKCFHEEKYGLAVNKLKNADKYQPGDYNVHKKLGTAYYKLAGLTSDIKKSFTLSQKARNHSQKAFDLNPIDSDTAYSLAIIENSMQLLHSMQYPQKNNNIFHPMTWFNKSIDLNPNGVRSRYALVRYLHQQSMAAEMLQNIQALVRIYPLSYQELKKETFWSPEVKTASFKGLNHAAAENILPRHAHMAITSIMAERKDWQIAISHYRSALQYDPYQNKAGDYHYLGRLYLKGADYDNAEKCFIKTMHMSRDREDRMDNIYHTFKVEGVSKDFLKFHTKIGSIFFTTPHMTILKARCLFDINQPGESKKVLMALNNENPHAEAYYWLALIAENDKDWDKMELAGQKASTLAPYKSTYHYIFSKALKQQNKLEKAEKSADLAIEKNDRPLYSLFTHRASIRWHRKDYKGVLQDLKQSIILKPDQADLYAWAGETNFKLGNQKPAEKYFEKALKLDPDNQKYKERYRSLKSL